MATILFSDALANPDVLDGFDPTSDILLFTEHTAADIKVSGDDTSVTFTTDDGSATLDVGMKTITSGSTGYVRFVDGSALIIGDGTVATVADDLSNNVGSLSTDGNDHFRGLGGNDSVNAGEGDDKVYGNTGNDSIVSFDTDGGTDLVFGGQGNDIISYSASNDGITAYGNLGDDTVIGSQGDDLTYGGQGDDTLVGNDGDDVTYGNADDDSIVGGDGDNTAFGGQGNDTIVAGSGTGSNLSYGNLGLDYIVLNDNGDVAFGGQGNDTIIGGDDNDEVFGNADADLFVNSDDDGDDAFTGGAGSDTLSQDLSTTTSTGFLDFNSEEDVISVSGVSAVDFAENAYGGNIGTSNERGFLLAGPDIILNGDFGTVTLEGAAGQSLHGDNLVLADNTVFVYNVGGAAGAFDGGAGNDFLIAGDAGDSLTAGAGDDTLIGGDGADLFALAGNMDGNDTLHGGDGNDSVTATVDDATSFTQNSESVEDFTFVWGSGTGDANIQISQTTGFTVDASSFTVGQDLILNVYSNAGIAIDAGTGDDQIYGTGSTVSGDTVNAGDGDDVVYGNGGADVIDGEAGTDWIFGGSGADTLTGGAGSDTFYAASGGNSGFTTATVDHITDFVGGEDFIQFSGGGAVVFDERLTDLSGSTDLADAAQDAYTAAGSVAASDAVLFVFGGRTYAYVNDGTAGFSTGDDLLLDITGFTGTITDASFV